MSDHRQAQRLMRSLARVTFEMAADRQRHEDAVALVAGGDMAQYVHVNVDGKVGREAVYLQQEIEFPYPFLMRVARTQTEGPQDSPHFSTGVEVKTDGHVMLDAQIRRWIEDDSQFITGAVVRIAVWSPDAPKLTTYSAIVHLTFFGFAAPVEDDTEG
jgi:hypothetical protein